MMQPRTDTPTHVIMARIVLGCVFVVLLFLGWCTAAHACASKAEALRVGRHPHYHVVGGQRCWYGRAAAGHKIRPKEVVVSVPQGQPATVQDDERVVEAVALPDALAAFMPNMVHVDLGKPQPIPSASPDKPKLEDAPPKIRGDVMVSDGFLVGTAAAGCGSAMGLAVLAFTLGWLQRKREGAIVPAELVPLECLDLPSDPPPAVRQQRIEQDRWRYGVSR